VLAAVAAANGDGDDGPSLPMFVGPDGKPVNGPGHDLLLRAPGAPGNGAGADEQSAERDEPG